MEFLPNLQRRLLLGCPRQLPEDADNRVFELFDIAAFQRFPKFLLELCASLLFSKVDWSFAATLLTRAHFSNFILVGSHCPASLLEKLIACNTKNIAKSRKPQSEYILHFGGRCRVPHLLGSPMGWDRLPKLREAMRSVGIRDGKSPPLHTSQGWGDWHPQFG